MHSNRSTLRRSGRNRRPNINHQGPHTLSEAREERAREEQMREESALMDGMERSVVHALPLW